VEAPKLGKGDAVPMGCAKVDDPYAAIAPLFEREVLGALVD
jgi:hypothetical protein